MRLFILAAGVGSRLFPLTKDKPKSLIDLGDGTTLLDRQIKNAVSCDSISEVVVITGYKSEQIDKKIKQYKERIKIKTLYNPYYEISNNLMSLWVANSLMKKSDFLISNGDNLYKPGLYDKIIAEAPKSTIQITLDHKDHYDEDDMKIQFDDDNRIMRIHKDIPLKKSRAESVGLVIVKGKKKRKLFIKKLISLSKRKQSFNKFWLDIFNSLIDDGEQLDYCEIDKNDWREMDFHPDMKLIKQQLANQLFK